MPLGLPDALADRYAFDREIGTGATATVFLATDLKHHRKVAIKVLRPELAASMAAERFLREIAIAAQLQHPHILPLLDSGSAGGSLYFVMPFVEGETLRARLERLGHLSVPEAIRILADVADALVHAHGHGVIHRDIKPDNVILNGRHAVVMDFGVAKAVNDSVDQQLTAGIAIGTPSYMAPEQAMADPNLDHRVDIYALGVLGYEILTGKPPFVGGSPREILTAHVVLAPESLAALRPDIPARLAAIVMRCLAKDREDRWQTAAQIEAQLDPLATPREGLAPVGVQSEPRRRRWAPWLVGAIGAAGLLAALWDRSGRDRAAAPTLIDQLTFLGSVLEGRYSPDGQFVAFVTMDQDAQRLWIRDETGSKPIELVSAQSIEGLTWVENGSEISYTALLSDGFRIERIPRLGGSRRLVATGKGLLAPDGRRVARAYPHALAVQVVELATGDTVSLARSPSYDWIAGLDWSPSSDRVLLALSDGSGRQAITTIDLAGRETVLVRDSATEVLAPRFGGDGRFIEYLRGDALYRLGLDERGRPLGKPMIVRGGLSIGYDEARTPFLGSLSVAAGGRSLVVQQQHRANLAVMRLGAGGAVGAPTPITAGTAWFREAKLSPRGDRIAVSQGHPSGGVVVGTIPMDGGDLVELARFQDGYELAWSPTGRQIAVIAGDPVLGLEVLDVDGGPSRRFASGQVGARVTWLGSHPLTTGARNLGLVETDLATGQTRLVPAIDTSTLVVLPRASPNGRWVALHAALGDSIRLWAISLADTIRRPLGRGRWFPVGWTAGSDSVFAASVGTRSNDLVLFSLAGGQSRLVATLPQEYRFQDVTPDGRTVLLTRSEGVSDLWVVRDLR